MRVLLAVLIGLAQVAGPWLCCCVTARAATPNASTPAPVDCCPHCSKALPELPAKPTPGLPEPCPCGGKATEVTPPAKPDLAAALDFDVPAISTSFAGPAVVVPLPPCGLSRLPFLPPGTRLFVHHVLRC